MKRWMIKTDQTATHNGCTLPLYRVPDPAGLADMLHEAAARRECFGANGKMAEALSYLAESFDVNGDGGEPWTEDDEGRGLWDLSDFMVAVIGAAAQLTKSPKPTRSIP